MPGSNSWYTSRTVMRRRRLFRALAAATGLTALGLACSNPERAGSTSGRPQGTTAAATGTQTPKRGGRWQDYMTQDPASLDPYKVVAFSAQQYVGAFVYSRLYKYNNGPGVNKSLYKPVPDLAVSHEITDDGLTYIIKIRPDARFHDIPPVNGRVLDAEDVVASYKRFVGLPAPQSATFKVAVDSAEVVDRQTVRFRLKAPYAPFLDMLANPGFLWIMPREADNGFDPTQRPIGTGPWVLDKHTPSVGIAYQRHPNYFLKDLPYMDGVDMYVISEYAQRLNQFKLGRLYTIIPQAQDFQDVVKASQGGMIVDIGIPLAWGGIGFGHLDPDSPTMRDERVRKAVSLALDRDGLLQAISNDAIWKGLGQTIEKKLNNFIPAALGQWWVDPRGSEMGSSAQWFKFDVGEAKRLLAAAGFPNGLSLEYHRTVQIYGTDYDSAAEALVPMLQNAGFRLDVKVDDYRSVWQPTSWAGKVRGLVYGLGAAFTDPDEVFNYLFGPDSSRNHMRVRDPQLLSLMEKQRQQLDVQERRKTVIEIQRYAADKMYFVPVESRTYSQKEVAHSFVQGYEHWRVPSGSYGGATESLMHLWLNR